MSDGRFNFLCQYQIDWINETAPVAGAEKSRRIGWTYADALRETLARAGKKPVAYNHWHSSADMTAAEEYIGYCAEFARMIEAVGRVSDGVEELVDEETGEAARINTMRIVFENGLKITAGSSNPKFFRSKGGSVGLDEFAFHPQGRELYKAAHATARFWGYPLHFWSTHNGPGSYFNQLIMQTRAGKLRAKIHRVTVLDAVEQGIVERIRMRRDRLKDIPAIDPKARQEWLDGLRAECPDDDVWNEEYLCIPSSDASSLLSYELINSATTENLQLIRSANDLPTDKGEFYAGYDVGRRHDFSVLWVVERVGDVLWTRMLRCLDRASFPAQEALINALMANYRVRRICIDEQGIGANLAENAMRRWKSRAEGVSLSGPVKASLGAAFRDRFLDHQIRIPAYVDWDEFDDKDPINRIINRRNLSKSRHRDDWLKEDLHKTKKSVTAAGNVRLAADSDADGHADGFWAGALMAEAAGGVPKGPIRIMKKPLGM
ncbi:MAG: terminase large subunit domain-containing protein [Bacillota bacterium]